MRSVFASARFLIALGAASLLAAVAYAGNGGGRGPSQGEGAGLAQRAVG